ncbi:MAG: prepilin-type N-terminal cleavage/methylation domain-containing protein [Bryobacteraceae bacterium]|nr:prepilin-type N-terminal cleavage/methylation domain-containing protein [Bryobacteraceae bacterium]MDW8379439.1 prepilin-type N-terminal cleavage/methylation domain-containing protein [Bryobacterales bacterium]
MSRTAFVSREPSAKSAVGLSPRRRRQRGFSLIEIMIVVAIILVIASIAIPKINAQRMQAHEMAAIRTIQAIHTAQTQYFSQFGRYAANLQELGPPASGSPGPAAADLIPGDLAAGTKSGYIFTVQGGPNGYVIGAVPVAFNNTGRRTFYSDQTLVVRQNWSPEPATAQSKEIN